MRAVETITACLMHIPILYDNITFGISPRKRLLAVSGEIGTDGPNPSTIAAGPGGRSEAARHHLLDRMRDRNQHLSGCVVGVIARQMKVKVSSRKPEKALVSSRMYILHLSENRHACR